MNAYVPFGAYWTTPFCKWQGSFAALEPIPLAAEVASRMVRERGISIDGLCLGTTIPSRHSFYGGPWLAGLMGLESLPAPTIAQACATGVRCVAYAADAGGTVLVVAADRTSNGPHLYYPNPKGPGGTGVAENWVLDNFSHDPFARNGMIQTAERVAAEGGIDRRMQDETTLLRYAQYREAVESGFHKRYMTPVGSVAADEGVFPTTADGLAALKPIVPGGTVTFGSQTHPADGNAGIVVTNRDRAREMSRDPNVEVRLLAHAQARVEKGRMPAANVPASRKALSLAGIAAGELAAVTTHLPFCVNDIYLARELGLAIDAINRRGCSLVWGHPQAPTGVRGIIELIEELAERGGGRGLFTGCAAGDSAAALVLEVNVRA